MYLSKGSNEKAVFGYVGGIDFSLKDELSARQFPTTQGTAVFRQLYFTRYCGDMLAVWWDL